MPRAVISSPIGPLGLETVGDTAVCRVDFRPGADPDSGPPEAGSLLAEVNRQLAAYFEGRLRQFDLPLAPSGTTFQQQVWTALCAIPYGQTRSYLEVARAVGRPDAVRAVGAANGRNPIPIIVPCHRVIGSDGSLTGFGGGLDTKRRLLSLERGSLFGGSLFGGSVVGGSVVGGSVVGGSLF